MLAAPDGRLRLQASSSEQVRLVELCELDGAAGPCLTAYRSGETMAQDDLTVADPRWTAFATRARQDGLRSVHAIPMRLREHTIGVLNLFAVGVGPLPHADQELGRALADMATISLRHHQLIEAHRGQSEQQQRALTTRLDIEQAKGLLAQRLGIDPPEAFQRLRRHARATNRKLADLARDVLTGRASLPEDDPPRQPRAGAAAYAHRAAESARAAARDAERSAHAAAQAQQDAHAVRQRLTRRRHADRDPDGPDSPA